MRLLACLLALVSMAIPWTAILHAAAPSLGQHTPVGVSSAGVSTSAMTSVTDGSFVLVAIGQSAADTDQSYTVTSSPSATWVDSACNSGPTTGVNNDRKTVIAYTTSIATTAGAVTITVTSANGAVQFRAHPVEVLGTNTLESVTAANIVAEAADGTSHNAAASLSTSADAFVYTMGTGNNTQGALTAITAPVTFTSLAGDFASTQSHAQYYNGGSAISSSNLAWSAATARTVASCTVSVVAAAAGTRPPNGLAALGAGV